MNIVWFRNDLRVKDNHSLKAACEADGPVVGFYTFDPCFYQEGDFGFTKTGKYRARFLIESVQNLRKNLAEHGIPLIVKTEPVEDCLPELLSHPKPVEAGHPEPVEGDSDTTHNIYLQREWTRDETDQEQRLGKALAEAFGEDDKPKGHRHYDQFLFHPEDVPYKNWSQIPKVYTDFRKKCEKNVEVRETVDIADYQQDMPDIPETEIPMLEDLGLEDFEKDDRTAFPWAGGEDSARERLEHYFWETEKLAKYKQTRNGLIGTDYSSKFSAWLAAGCISPRQIYHEVKKFEKEVKKNQDTYWLIFELIWRDFFKYVSLKHDGDFFKLGGILQKDYDWNDNKAAMKDWINGTTKEPFVNANMKEIAATGFMSNRGRQNVASYWAKELKQDWRMGAAYFEHILIDYDVHSNWGNWMYNSGVGNDPRDRKFNIQSQADRYDSDGKYREMWLEDYS
jgi:deoxyribodipyrimidine photo-lyase